MSHLETGDIRRYVFLTQTHLPFEDEVGAVSHCVQLQERLQERSHRAKLSNTTCTGRRRALGTLLVFHCVHLYLCAACACMRANPVLLLGHMACFAVSKVLHLRYPVHLRPKKVRTKVLSTCQYVICYSTHTRCTQHTAAIGLRINQC